MVNTMCGLTVQAVSSTTFVHGSKTLTVTMGMTFIEVDGNGNKTC